jgi:serine/threonine protein kinase
MSLEKLYGVRLLRESSTSPDHLADRPAACPARALQFVCDQGVIHSDVKPENVLLGPSNRIWLADFGIAIMVLSVLEKGIGGREVKGTARYMAPEQIQGNPVPASEQYALAVMVYEWLCGRPPFHGSVLGVHVGHVSTPPPALRDHVLSISPAVERVCSQAGGCSKADVLVSTPLLGVAARSKNVPGHPISDEQRDVLPSRTLVSVC